VKFAFLKKKKRYSESLNASKSLHHKIILVESSNKRVAGKIEKESCKARKMKEVEEKKRLLKEECKQMQVFEQLRTSMKCIEELEVRIRGFNWPKYCPKFLFNLEVLKIKLLKYEGCLLVKDQELNGRLFRLIKNLFYNHHAQLSRESGEKINEYLNILVGRGFNSTASYLKGFILKKLEANKADEGGDAELRKTARLAIEAVERFQVCSDTFNNDVVFQLNFLGNILQVSIIRIKLKTVKTNSKNNQINLLKRVFKT